MPKAKAQLQFTLHGLERHRAYIAVPSPASRPEFLLEDCPTADVVGLQCIMHPLMTPGRDLARTVPMGTEYMLEVGRVLG